MSARRSVPVAFLAAIAMTVSLVPITAWGSDALRPNMIAVEYRSIDNEEHRQIEAIIRKNGVLERVANILSPLKLPRRLTLRTASCDGDVNTYYENSEITLCYEYLATILKRVTDKQTLQGTTRRNLIIGAVVDAFFHEAAHAAFDMLEIPLLGREEDAADQFSAYLMLQFGRSEARQLIAGAAFWFVNEQLESTPPGLEDYASHHGLPAQRFFNYICLAYGADAQFFTTAVDEIKGIKNRARHCASEYQQVERAFQRLILPYVDRALLAEVQARTNWFDLDAVD